MNKAYAWAFLLVAVSTLQGQNIEVFGRFQSASTVSMNTFYARLKNAAVDKTALADSNGLFAFNQVLPGAYQLDLKTQTGYVHHQSVFIGSVSEFLDLGVFIDSHSTESVGEVQITARQNPDQLQGDKQVYVLSASSSQLGGSVLQALNGLPGMSVVDGKVQIRGSSQVAILMDGKQTALTGFGNQESLQNIPASAIERIEVIHDPTAAMDANGSAGVINIVLKKSEVRGWTGRAGYNGGFGALGIKQANWPGVGDQYRFTPKINPSIAIQNKQAKSTFYVNFDEYYNPTLNKNEFVTRIYDSGDTILQQTRRNRQTWVSTGKAGLDIQLGKRDYLSSSFLYSYEQILDHGEEPFYLNSLDARIRNWTYLEDEIKKTSTANVNYEHKFHEPGNLLKASYSFTSHTEDEQYFFQNELLNGTGNDSFKLYSVESVHDFNLEYRKALAIGRFDVGVRERYRGIPTDMQFKPGWNSSMDKFAGGWAQYRENNASLYGDYYIENETFQLQSGLRMEYVHVHYEVDPNNPVYKSDGYSYFKPFPNAKLTYKTTHKQQLSLSLNQRVDRPAELDIRVFPKYDDAEIVKVGNPGLKPQYTQNVQLEWALRHESWSLSFNPFYRRTTSAINRVSSTDGVSPVVYSTAQNAGKSYSKGLELMVFSKMPSWGSIQFTANAYESVIDSFSCINIYPVAQQLFSQRQALWSGNAKLVVNIKTGKHWSAQLLGWYQAPDLMPLGKVGSRYYLDAGIQHQPIVFKKGKLEWFVNMSDVFNTSVIRQTYLGANFTLQKQDYYETQALRFGLTWQWK